MSKSERFGAGSASPAARAWPTHERGVSRLMSRFRAIEAIVRMEAGAFSRPFSARVRA